MTVSIKDFVKTALLEISEGVAEARREARVNIAPGYVEGRMQLDAQNVNFDLQVEVVSENKGSANAGISVPVLGIVKATVDVGGETGNRSTSSQRISFCVPIYFQSPTNQEDQ